jgi:hypothetical protein
LFEKQIKTVCSNTDGLRNITPRELDEINREFDQVMLSVRFRDGSERSENMRNANAAIRSVRVPQAIKIMHTPVVVAVSVDHDSLALAELNVDRKLTTGVMWKLYVHPANVPRPSQPQRTGMSSWTDFNLGSAILNSEEHDFPIRGQPFIIEMDLAIFETPVPPQHMWNVVMGANYRVLWRRVIKQPIE